MRLLTADPVQFDVAAVAGPAWDPDAFGELYRRHEAALVRYFMRRTGRAELAADLTSETFAAALLRWRSDRIRPACDEAWLYGIARHKLIDSYRRGRVEDDARRRLGMRPTPLDDESLRAIEALTEPTPALELVQALSDEERVAIIGRVVDGRTYAELAAELGLSEHVVRKRVSRGLARVRAAIGARP